MNFSLYEIIKMIRDNYMNLSIEDINFILVVIRDNCLNDNTYKYINKLLNISNNNGV